MNKKIILTDLDNTIIDFKKCSEIAMETLFLNYSLKYEKSMFKVFTRINNMLWKKIETGELSKSELRKIRWNTIFNELNISFDGEKFETEFENMLSNTAVHVEGAEEILKYLSLKYEIYAVTNGFAFVQHNRMKISGLQKYFKGMFISEEVGFEKPSVEFFDIVFDKLGNPDKDDVILIGDSLTADIIGGVKYGIETVWLDREKSVTDDNISTYRVETLEEIKNII